MSNGKTEEEVLQWLKQLPHYELDKETMEKQLQYLRKQTLVSKPKRSIRKWGIRLLEWCSLTAAIVAIVFLIPQLAPFDDAPASLPKNTGANGTQAPLPQTNHQGDDNADTQNSLFQPPMPPESENAVALDEVPKNYLDVLPQERQWALDYAIRFDLDGDENPDYILAYRLPESQEIHVSVLFGLREGVLETSLRGDPSTLDSLYALDGIWMADLTGDGQNEILVGNSMGASVGSVLEVYVITAAGPDIKDFQSRPAPVIRQMDTISYHHLEWGDFDKDGLIEIATWTKDTGNAYQVEVFQFQQAFQQDEKEDHPFLPDPLAYPTYFPKVVQYYDHLVKQAPYRVYWYYFADAAAKSGQMEKAKQAIQKGLTTPEGDYPEAERFLDLAKKYGIPLDGR